MPRIIVIADTPRRANNEASVVIDEELEHSHPADERAWHPVRAQPDSRIVARTAVSRVQSYLTVERC